MENEDFYIKRNDQFTLILQIAEPCHLLRLEGDYIDIWDKLNVCVADSTTESKNIFLNFLSKLGFSFDLTPQIEDLLSEKLIGSYKLLVSEHSGFFQDEEEILAHAFVAGPGCSPGGTGGYGPGSEPSCPGDPVE